MAYNYLDKTGLKGFWDKIVAAFVRKEDGKGLSTNDFTNEEKAKLAGIEEGANNYTLPAATTKTLGGVKVGAGLTVTPEGLLSATGGGTADAVEWDNVLNKPETFPPSEHTHEQYLQLAGGTMTGNIDMGSATKVINLVDPTNNGDAVNKKYADAKLGTKADKATTLAGYGITDAYTKAEVDGKISSVYKPAGTVSFAELPASLTGLAGNVYNLSDAFTTDGRFVEGAGKSYPIGTNVVVTADEKFDVLPGFIDLSGYTLKSELVAITKQEIDEITTL